MDTTKKKVSRNSVWGGYILWTTITSVIVMLITVFWLKEKQNYWLLFCGVFATVAGAMLSHMLLHPRNRWGYLLCGLFTVVSTHLLASLIFTILSGCVDPLTFGPSFYKWTQLQFCHVAWLSVPAMLVVSFIYGSLPLPEKKEGEED